MKKDTCTPMFIATLFTIARTWKQPRCPSTDEWIKKLWYIHTMENYSATNWHAFESMVMRWVNLQLIIQSEVSQKEKNKYRTLTHIYGIQKEGTDEPICRVAVDTLGEGNGTPLQYSCLENPMDGGAQQAAVHGVTRVRHDIATKPSSIYFTHDSVYISMLLSQFAPPSPSPTMTTSPFSTRLISTIFLDSICVCVCVCVCVNI